jgi:MFS family permease
VNPREFVGLLRNTQLRRLFFGRLVTNAGDSLYYIASMWLVYDLTGSEFYTGVAGFLVMIPSAAQFLFGPLVDRISLRRLLVGTQVIQGVLVLVVPLAAAVNMLSVWVLLTVMPLLSLLNQPVYPAQSAALPRIVDREELVGANSLFSMAYQGVDAAFNALGGVIVATVGAVALFWIDSATFALATLLFLGLNIPEAGEGDVDPAAEGTEDDAEADRPSETGDQPTESDKSPQGDDPVEDPTAVADGGEEAPAADRETDTEPEPDAPGAAAPDGGPESDSYLEDLREGIGFLRGTVVAKLTLGVIIVNFAFGGTLAVLPAYGAQLGGAQAYGILAAAVGVGMLTGSLVGNAVEDYPFGRVVAVGMFVSAALWGAAVYAGSLPATPVLLALALVPAGTMNVLVFSLVQALVPDRLLGRVMSVLGSAASAMTPVGALVGGTVAEATSPTMVLWGSAFATLLFGAYVAAVPSIRRLPRVGAVSTLDTD